MALVISPLRLKAARLHAGLTVMPVAVAIDKSYPSVLAYERGVQQPPAVVLVRLAELYGCDLRFFFEDAEVASCS
jgi:transcriptional regulator with XRE-family HTH domain